MVIGSAYAVTCQSNEFEYDGQCIENKFQITTTNDTDKFVFSMSAKGTFYIDWGDGNVEMINRTGTTMTEYTHNYASANEYIIKFGGLATGYNNTVVYDRSYITAIIFGSGAYSPNNTNKQIKGISGSLGAIFPTLGDTTGLSGDSKSLLSIQPRFYRTFGSCSNIVSSIPPNLFSGLYGQMAREMFYATFYSCSGLTGAIPDNLFANLSGQSVGHLFRETFWGCSGLTGTDIDDPNNPGQKYAIPPNLFSIIKTGTAMGEFYDTFNSCSGLTGTIPDSLFAGVIGRTQQTLFHRTFNNCRKLTGSIPANLFAGVFGAYTNYLFYQTFYNCKGLTGTDIDDPNNPGMKYAIPPTLFSGISGAPITNLFYNTFYGCSGLTGTIPSELFSGISGAPAPNMFYATFRNCSGLTGSIPANLFSGISGAPATNMFYYTFYGCSGLTGAIPGNLFSGISGVPVSDMFVATFGNCTGLTGTDIDDPNNPGMKYAIPPTLFSGIVGKPMSSMFNGTFSGASNLTGTIPETLFAGISGKPQPYMFMNTFNTCRKLIGPIPGNLFAGIIGKPASYMFKQTFNACTNLGKIAVGGTSTYYIPPELFAGIDKTSTATDMMTSVFANTGLLTTCPSGTNQYITGFESWFSGKQSCTECPVAYPDYDTTNQQCYAQVTFIDSDNNTLLKKEDVYYDAQNASGYNLPSYSPVKPDTILDNWTTGDGTVIGSADLLTGNQVVYSDWGFHCDSGHYFHAGNEQICTAETKRTEHALVIKPDANHTYYIHATPNSEHDYTINSSSIHKMKVNYNGTIYNLHDASVYFSD